MGKFNLADSGEDFMINDKKEIKAVPVEDKKMIPPVSKEPAPEKFSEEKDGDKEEKKEKARKVREQEPKKQKPGRPSFKEKGLKKRKQYTLTLLEDTYDQIMENATIEGVSFAKYMEKAVLYYMENHKHV